jgi:nicotinamidase/pyrazinamidase
VAGGEGAAFHRDLRLPPGTVVITKGHQSGADGYSAFEGTTAAGSSLLDDLRSRGVTRLVVGGLATDYCVRASVLDAKAAGLDVIVLEDAIAGVDVEPGDSARAIEEMKAAGVRFAQAREVGAT